MTPRAVFDCMVFLQAAARAGGPADACFTAAIDDRCELVLSDDVRAEWADAAGRASTRASFKTMTDDRVAELFARVDLMATRVPTVPAVVAFTRDPDDAMYLDLAVASAAGYVVTRDKQLLSLMTATDPEAVAFRTAHPTVRILDPVSFLQSLAAEAP